MVSSCLCSLAYFSHTYGTCFPVNVTPHSLCSLPLFAVTLQYPYMLCTSLKQQQHNKMQNSSATSDLTSNQLKEHYSPHFSEAWISFSDISRRKIAVDPTPYPHCSIGEFFKALILSSDNNCHHLNQSTP